MTLVEEGPLAELGALEARVHVVDRLSPPIDLRGCQWRVLRLFRQRLFLWLLEPDTLPLGLLLITALVLLVTLDLVVDERLRFASPLDGSLSCDLHVRLEQLHVGVLLLQLVLEPLDVGGDLALRDVFLLLEHLTVGRDLDRIVQLHRLAVFFPPAGCCHLIKSYNDR